MQEKKLLLEAAVDLEEAAKCFESIHSMMKFYELSYAINTGSKKIASGLRKISASCGGMRYEE